MDTNKETTNNHLNKHQHLEIGYNKIIDNNNVEDTQTGEEIGIEEYVVDITNSIEHMEDKIMVEAATNKTPTMIVITTIEDSNSMGSHINHRTTMTSQFATDVDSQDT